MSRVVIWGLRNRSHSHKFIHKGFFENFVRLGFETIWVEDLKQNQHLVRAGDIVFAVDIASTHLPSVKNTKYVLHNISPESMQISDNYLVLQVYTRDVPGKSIGMPWVSWDAQHSTLYQPWGVPEPSTTWLTYSYEKSHSEFWVGSIWNNNLKQGNQDFIDQYKIALKSYQIEFKRVGNSTIFRPNGISEERARRLINRSPIGASVVGEWQRKSSYVPCRFFKNISAGAVPSSNSDFSELLGGTGGVFESDPLLLIEKVLTLSNKTRYKMTIDAQEAIKQYTYLSGIERILSLL